MNLIYQPTDWTTLHAGYSRYFTPPPLENVPASSVAAFNGTSDAIPGSRRTIPSKPSARIISTPAFSQKITKHLQVGVDGYYKTARNQLDDGLFGQSLILSAFNYAKGRVYGVEFTGSYNKAAFPPMPTSPGRQAQGKDWESAQFLFDPNDLAYVKTIGYIWTTISGSLARSARLTRGMKASTTARSFIPTRFMAAACGRMAAEQSIPQATRFPTAPVCRRITPSTSARSRISKSPITRC